MSSTNPTLYTDTFVFHTKWKKILEKYSDKIRLEVFDAIVDYAESGKTKELGPLAEMAFSFIKYEIDYYRKRHEDKVEKCRASARASVRSRTTGKSSPREGKSESSEEVSGEYKVYSDMSSDDFINAFFHSSRQGSLEALCLNLHTQIDEIRIIAAECVNEWKLSESTHKDFTDAAKHLVSHIRRKIQSSRPDKDGNNRRASLLYDASRGLIDAIDESAREDSDSLLLS